MHNTLYVDEQSVESDFVVDTTTVEDALRHIQESVCDADRLVVSLQCDGQEVPAEKMGDILGRPMGSFERLDVFTDTKARLVFDAMTQSAACLAETNEACKSAADLLTEGRTVDAATALGGCLRVWQQIHDAVVKSITMLEVDPEVFSVNDEPLIKAIGRPRDALIQVRDALVSRDYVMLADLLQYEFNDVTACWQSIVDALREQSERAA